MVFDDISIFFFRQQMTLEKTEGSAEMFDMSPVKDPNPTGKVNYSHQRAKRSVHPSSGRTSTSMAFTAVVFGAGHIRTFDGTTYQFPGMK